MKISPVVKIEKVTSDRLKEFVFAGDGSVVTKTEHEPSVEFIQLILTLFKDLLNSGLVVSPQSGSEGFDGRNRNANEALGILLRGVPTNHGINDLVDFLCSFCMGARRFG